MERGRDDTGKAKTSTSEKKALVVEETAWKSEVESEDEGEETAWTSEEEDEDAESMETEAAYWNNGLAAKLGNGGLIRVLVGTPSGFAIFGYVGIKLLKPNACQNIWVDFADLTVAKRAVVLKEFLAVGDKFSTISSTGVSDALADMIKRHIGPGQKLAVENEDYKNAIENSLKISCLYDPTVEELMWGLKINVAYLVPAENPEVVKEDLFPMCEGMKSVLNFHSFKVKPDMMVTRRIIELAGIVYECDRCVNKHNDSLRSAAEHLTEISNINTQDWDLMKLATALKMICTKETVTAPPSLFSKQEWVRMRKDAHKYESKILKEPLLEVYDEVQLRMPDLM